MGFAHYRTPTGSSLFVRGSSSAVDRVQWSMTHPSERLVNGPTRDEGEEFREQLVENPSSRLIFEERGGEGKGEMERIG